MTVHKILFPLSLIFLLTNWTDQNSTVEGRGIQKVNFYGTLTTHQNKILQIDNISVADIYKQIPVYEKPSPETVKAKNSLETNPNIIIFSLDLSEIGEIQIPFPDTTWTYQENGRKVEYLEIVVISNDTNKTKREYLIEKNRIFYCREKNNAGPTEIKLQPAAIKSLKILGFKHRDEIKQEESQKKACPHTPAPTA